MGKSKEKKIYDKHCKIVLSEGRELYETLLPDEFGYLFKQRFFFKSITFRTEAIFGENKEVGVSEGLKRSFRKMGYSEEKVIAVYYLYRDYERICQRCGELFRIMLLPDCELVGKEKLREEIGKITNDVCRKEMEENKKNKGTYRKEYVRKIDMMKAKLPTGLCGKTLETLICEDIVKRHIGLYRDLNHNYGFARDGLFKSPLPQNSHK